ncbi:MAG: hypothetical protein K0T99_01245 [Alphaproteobacteria bacterium]|nr:hypothetical protein [Alphaproteobacteria bacterium]
MIIERLPGYPYALRMLGDLKNFCYRKTYELHKLIDELQELEVQEIIDLMTDLNNAAHEEIRSASNEEFRIFPTLTEDEENSRNTMLELLYYDLYLAGASVLSKYLLSGFSKGSSLLGEVALATILDKGELGCETYYTIKPQSAILLVSEIFIASNPTYLAAIKEYVSYEAWNTYFLSEEEISQTTTECCGEVDNSNIEA